MAMMAWIKRILKRLFKKKKKSSKRKKGNFAQTDLVSNTALAMFANNQPFIMERSSIDGTRPSQSP